MKIMTAKSYPTKGEQVAVGIDPSRSALHLAILAPQGLREIRIPWMPAALTRIEEILGKEQGVRIGIEGAGSLGALVLWHWLGQGYDVRKVNPQVSKRLRECFTEAHTDRTDAQGLAWSVRFHPDLPKVRLTLTTAALKKLGRLRQRLVKTQTALLNQLHALLTESYGSTYKALFPKLKSKKALEFFHTFPTLDDALAELPRVQKLLGEEKARILAQAGKWGKAFI